MFQIKLLEGGDFEFECWRFSSSWQCKRGLDCVAAVAGDTDDGSFVVFVFGGISDLVGAWVSPLGSEVPELFERLSRVFPRPHGIANDQGVDTAVAGDFVPESYRFRASVVAVFLKRAGREYTTFMPFDRQAQSGCLSFKKSVAIAGVKDQCLQVVGDEHFAVHLCFEVAVQRVIPFGPPTVTATAAFKCLE